VLHDCAAVCPNVVPDEALKIPLLTERSPQSIRERNKSFTKSVPVFKYSLHEKNI
jgi:hypothetical protein